MNSDNHIIKAGYIYYIFFGICIFSIILSCLLLPLIPVGGGTGWDGGVYYGILQSICKGEIGRGGEPYYFMRIGAIIHLIPIELFFKNMQITLDVARFFSSLFAISGVLLAIISSYKNSDAKKSSEILHVLILVSSISTFAVFTIPTFYPILSDYLAILISGLSLYIWNIGNNLKTRLLLVSLTFISFFIMPGLFVIPLFLMCFTKSCSAQEDYKQSKVKKFLWGFANSQRFYWGFSTVVTLFAVIYIYASCAAFVFPSSYSNKYSVFIGLPELRVVSTFLILLFVGLFPFLFFARFRNVIASLNLPNLILGAMSLTAFFVVYTRFAVSNSGFKGPDLIHNLIQQALSSPISSLPAIFSYFGPVGIIGIYIALFGKISAINSVESKNTNILASLSLVFIFFLILGNETRQFICVFPLLVYLVCSVMNGRKIMLLIYICIFSIAILLIGHPMDDNTSTALKQNMSAMEWPWQYYFGRQGPYMSTTSRLLWSSLLTLFLIGLFIFQNFKTPNSLFKK